MPSSRLTVFNVLIKIAMIVSFILAVTLSPVLLLLLYIWKSIVTFCAITFHRDLSLMKFIDYVIGVLIDLDIEDPKSTNFNGNVGITCKINGNINGHEFFNLFEKNVINIDYSKEIPPNHKHIRFHQSIYRFGGYWFFKTFKNKLKYEDLMTCTTLENNNSYEEIICEWLKIRYDIKKCPLWGILLIYRKETHDTIFAFKIHHILADGFSLVHILDLLTNTPSKIRENVLQGNKWKTFMILAKSSFGYFEDFITSALSVDQSPIYRRKNEDDIFLTYLTIPASVIKDIRQKAQVRFQAVMLCLILKYVNNLINERVDDENIPDKIGIVKSLPWPNHPQNELCNHFTSAHFGFKIRNKNNPNQENMTDINNMFQDFHDRYYDKASYYCLKWISLLPVEVLGAAQNKLAHKLTAAFGHTISSEEYSKIFGFECQDINLFLVPRKQKSISVTGVTISNEIKLTIMGPKSLFSSQEQTDKFSRDNFLHHIPKLNC